MTLLVSPTTYILASLHSHTSHTSHISRITTLPHSIISLGNSRNHLSSLSLRFASFSRRYYKWTICLLFSFSFFQISAIPHVYVQQLWNVAVLLISTRSFLWWGFISLGDEMKVWLRFVQALKWFWPPKWSPAPKWSPTGPEMTLR